MALMLLCSALVLVSMAWAWPGGKVGQEMACTSVQVAFL